MTTPPPTEDHFRYDVMVQEALLGVVRKILTETARQGLSGEHHFYITFRSEGPGVKLSARLKEKYPEEMTIVLQHQFWDLTVGDHAFEVGLSFGGVPEKLVIPYEALTGFYDPSVQFGLKFSPDEAAADNDQGEEAAPPPKAKKPSRRKKDEEAHPPAAPEAEAPAAEQPAPAADGAEKPASGAEVVSLDAFRKKK